jgi:protein O-GlcNAc transferase
VPNRAASTRPADKARQWFEQALALHQNGQTAKALALYERVLQIQPEHFDALHLSGIIAVQSKNPAKAADLIARAIAVNPQHAAAHYNLGVALQALGQLGAAAASYSRAVALQPDHLSAHYNRANVLHDLKQHQGALESYNAVIALKPDHVNAHNNRGAVLQNLGLHQAALESYDRAIALQPAADIYHNRGITLKTLGRHQDALASFNRAIALQPGYADAHNSRGLVLQLLRQSAAALDSYNTAIALQPDFAEAYYNRGNLLKDARQFQAALDSYDQALVLRPDYADAFCNRGVVLRDLRQHTAAEASYDMAITLYGAAVAKHPEDADTWYSLGNALRDTLQFRAALESYDRAIALQPDHADVHWVAGLCRLQTGDFERGWQEHEWRWRRAEKKPLLRNFPQPLWLGAHPLLGKTILLYSEQGLGDTLQFCRYAKLVADLGATVILEARPALIPLLRSLAGVSTLVAEGEPLPAFDFQCPLMSLPLAFKTTLESLPAPDRYLAADPAKVAEWRDRLGEKTRLRVGLAWSGSPTHKNDLYRSIALAELVQGLPQGPQYVSLQKEVRAADAETLRLCAIESQPEILHFGDLLHDFSDTAALCELLDIVISVDTSIAHLAGALGRPLWLLLPFIAEWRWLLDRTDSPWYPGARLYRQTQMGEWDGVMRKVHDDLAQRVSDLGAAFKATPADPAQNARAHYNRANALQTQGDLDAAIGHYRQALLLDPAYAEAHNNLGIALLARDEADAAIESYRQALLLRPDYARAHNNLGNALQAQGSFAAATGHYLNALALEPNYAEAHNNLGNTWLTQGKFDAALECYQKALALKPDYAEAYFNLGNAFRLLDKPEAAIANYRRALALQPYYVDAYNNLGSVLLGQGRLDEAVACYRRVLELEPENAKAYGNLGSALLEQGEYAAALENYRKALSLKPDSAEAHSNLLLLLSYQAKPDAYLEEARRYGGKVTARAEPRTRWPLCRNDGPAEPLRIGLVSGDLRAHPVGFFLESVITHLDPERVTLVAYSTVTQEDALTARIQPHFAEWNSIAHLSDEVAARKIHADGIHILMDLAGHTAHNRLPLFAWKPAPVQASWLGYFASTGVPAMDYLLADATSVPESQRAQFTETLQYLPETRLCFTPPDAPALLPQPLPAAHTGYITFGSFQKLFKINDAVLALWGRIFDALPDARLRLQNAQVNCPVTRERLLKRLRDAGISEKRVSLVKQAGREEYLAAHAEVDIILDTFPYTGGTTTCEALWMGVPTLTLAGDTLLSHQGASLLACAGLADWVAGDADDYVARALNHASDVGRLTRLRAGLRQQVLASPLYDAPRFARHFEAACAAMYERWQANLPSGHPGDDKP